MVTIMQGHDNYMTMVAMMPIMIVMPGFNCDDLSMTSGDADDHGDDDAFVVNIDFNVDLNVATYVNNNNDHSDVDVVFNVSAAVAIDIDIDVNLERIMQWMKGKICCRLGWPCLT